MLSLPVVCLWLWKEPVCWWLDEDADLETDRVTADAWSYHVAATAMYSQAQALEVCHRLVDVILWQIFSDGLQGDFQLISRLRFRLGCMVLSIMTSQTGSNLESLRSTQSSQWLLRIQSVLHDARTLRNRGCLGWNSINVVILRCISTKLVIKCIYDSEPAWAWVSAQYSGDAHHKHSFQQAPACIPSRFLSFRPFLL